VENKDIVLKGADVYVIRTMANDEFGNSKPCENCIRLLKQCQIYRVYYSIKNPETTEITYQVEKISEIRADHISRGNKSLKRIGYIEKNPRM